MADLSLEKQLLLQNFRQNVDKMSREQAQEMLKELYQHHLITLTCYNELLKKYMLPELGVDNKGRGSGR